MESIPKKRQGAGQASGRMRSEGLSAPSPLRAFLPIVGPLLLALVTAPAPALAHKMKVFATTEGALVRGYAYFSGNSRAVEARLTITTADGQTVRDDRTDADGAFQYTARQRQDHTIQVDSGDGHVARFIIPADQLPPTLPEPATGTAAPAIPVAQAPIPAPAPASPVPAPAPVATADPAPVPACPSGDGGSGDDGNLRLEQMVARQIRPLREQVEAYQEKIWWHDVLGGLGYIAGLSGLALAWVGRRPGGGNVPEDG
mgnify:CR=1 FL=1